MLEQLVQIAELIGLIVIMVSLVFIAIQIKQAAEGMRSEARQVQTNQDLSLVSILIEYPAIGKAYSQAETPSFEEKTQLVFWIIGQLRAREHEYMQYKSGVLDEAAWESYRGVIYFVLGTPRARQMWGQIRSYFNPEFSQVVDTMISHAEPVDFWKQLDGIA